jgi:hypothetical protein
MQLYNKNKGTGNIIARVGKSKYVLAAGQFTEVPDEVAEKLLAQYPDILSCDKGAKAVKETAAKVSEANEVLTAKVAELESICLAKDAEIAKLKEEIADVLTAKGKRGRPARVKEEAGETETTESTES